MKSITNKIEIIQHINKNHNQPYPLTMQNLLIISITANTIGQKNGFIHIQSTLQGDLDLKETIQHGGKP